MSLDRPHTASMRVTALVERADHVCCRYRLAAYRADLERAGHTLELRPWPRRWWKWFRMGQELRHVDVVVIQRRLLPLWQLCLVRRAAARLVYDFDDAMFLRDSYARRGLHSSRRLRRFRAMVRAADVVRAGNAYLAEQASRWTEPGKVRVMPTCVDVKRYPVAEHELDGAADDPACAVQLVWIGSASTIRSLETISPTLEQLGQQISGVRLKLICDRSLDLEHLLVVPCPWTEAGEATELAAADIGISWMPDDDWSRGKCGLKILQYMAAGLPVVANPAGIHTELIENGVTGFLADSNEAWVRAIERLVRDPGLRSRMGQAGRRFVTERYDHRRGVESWLELRGRPAQRAAA